jgi:hypothetical protein
MWIFLISINIIIITFYATTLPHNGDSDNIKKELHKLKEKASEVPSKPEGVSEDLGVLPNAREAKGDPKEIYQNTTIRRPLKFRKFRIVVEIESEEPRDDDYVKKEIDKLISLIKSVSEVKNIKINKLVGVSVRKDEERIFNINLD